MGSGFPVQFVPQLGAGMWAALAAVPLGIIALYFLKLRRRPVQVPSTLLWRRSVEDLRVNSLFQRLRKSLLLILQLLVAFLVILALLGPRMRGTVTQGGRFVLAIDNSASMNATDVKPTRLAAAKAEAKKIVAGMSGDDVAMVISFSDRARVVSNYTGNRSLLNQRIDGIAPTEATTSLREALQVAAGLANPQKEVEGVATAPLIPPKLKIYTDGGFADVEGFSLGNLEPEVIVIGTALESAKPAEGESRADPASNNVAILALQTRRNEEKPDIYQVFGRVHNYRAEDVATEAQLLRHDPARPGAAPTLIDAVALTVGARSDQSFNFDLPDTGAAELEVRLKDVGDDLPLDDRAFTLIGSPRKAQILAVTAGNRYLVDTLRTPLAQSRADVVVVTPADAKGDDLRRDVAAGRFDLVIYDRVRPDQPPEANALYFGALPPGPAYEKASAVESPVILDVNGSHPLMQYIRDLSVVRVAKATVAEPPPGSTVLIEGDSGPLAFVAPRGGFADAVVGFALVDGSTFNTDWVTKYSFPLFLLNAVQTLGNAVESAGEEVHAPGQPVVLRAEASPDAVTVTGPAGKPTPLAKTPQGTFLYNDANATGLYRVAWEPDGRRVFAVNQFDARESNLAPRGLVPEGVPADQAEGYKIKIGYNPVVGTARSIQTPRDWWKPLALLALGVVVVEWYVYNRRVTI
ncbi:vWA domain-containing protein [Tundrisphaera sp. TA3]|uniref:vWA domain-containing protein n=1 Tax=Tundrisphaera sp. TA3 TaxID=3435775 RepID=UPI003EB9F6EA